MSSIADMLTGVASSLRTVLTSINDSLSAKDVQEAETLSEVPDQIASISTGIPTAMDGGLTTVDGYVTVQSEDGRSLVIDDAGFDGSDAVGCFVKIRHQRSGTTIIQGVLVIPTDSTQTEPYRIFDMHLDAAKNLTITSNFLSAGAEGFETGEHFLSLTLPSNVVEDFIVGTDSYGEYFVYPIRGNRRS